MTWNTPIGSQNFLPESLSWSALNDSTFTTTERTFSTKWSVVWTFGNNSLKIFTDFTFQRWTMTNTHMQRKIQGREEENVETDGSHHGLQNNSSQSEDLESLTMSEVSSRTADNLKNRISIQLHFIYLRIDRRVSLMHFNLAENHLLLYFTFVMWVTKDNFIGFRQWTMTTFRGEDLRGHSFTAFGDSFKQPQRKL